SRRPGGGCEELYGTGGSAERASAIGSFGLSQAIFAEPIMYWRCGKGRRLFPGEFLPAYLPATLAAQIFATRSSTGTPVPRNCLDLASALWFLRQSGRRGPAG